MLTVVDCLFLDLYVPTKAIENPSIKLPVISWFYGGGFLSGGKDLYTPLAPIYDGRGAIEASGGNVIFIASNYRVSRKPGSTRRKKGRFTDNAHPGWSMGMACRHND